MEHSTHKASNSALGWIGLIIAILALILAWSAYNRSGVDLEKQIEMKVDEAIMEASINMKEAEDTARQATSEALKEGADAMDEGAQDVRSDSEDEMK